MTNSQVQRVFLSIEEANELASNALALDASLASVIRTLLRLWADGEIMITPAVIADKRGRHVVRERPA